MGKYDPKIYTVTHIDDFDFDEMTISDMIQELKKIEYDCLRNSPVGDVRIVNDYNYENREIRIEYDKRETPKMIENRRKRDKQELKYAQAVLAKQQKKVRKLEESLKSE